MEQIEAKMSISSKGWTQAIRSPLIRDTITTTVLSTFGKGVGFLIPFFIAAWFGISADTDAFFFAYGLIVFLANIFSPMMEVIIVPFIAEQVSKGEDVGAFVGRVLVMSGVALSLLSSVFLVFIRPILSWLTNFTPEGLDLVFIILLESIPLMILLVWTSILVGVLNAYKVFSLPSLSPAFRAVVTLGFIFGFKATIGVHSIALGYVVGELFRLFVLLLILKRMNLFRLRLSIGYEGKFIEFFKTSSYLFIGVAILSNNTMTNRIVASWAGTSSVSIIEYAERLYQIPVNFIGNGLFVVLLSHWSNDFYRGDEEAFAQKVLKTSKIVLAGTFLFSLVLIVLRHPLANLAYGHGKFNPEYMAPIIGVFSINLISFAPSIVGMIFMRGHMVLKNTKIFLLFGALNFILNIAFNLILIRPYGVYGIAWATTIPCSLIPLGLYFSFMRARTNICAEKIR